jgi:dipeptidyl aminopeptidase/acylaminoacyl peptidase
MEMFLALARSPYLQRHVVKAVSLSGLLDMREAIRDRDDLKQMFIEDFGLMPGINEEEWIELRNPLSQIARIRKNLPIFIMQGTEDIRVPLCEGLAMVMKMQEGGHTFDYLEIPGGNHCLKNIPNTLDLIGDWLEKN